MHQVLKAAIPLLILVGFFGSPKGAAAQEERPFGLSTMFRLGHLLADTNGDSVPDALNATLVVGSTATTAERMAAAEIAARLGFETMALTLPLSAVLVDGSIGIAIGQTGFEESGLEAGDFLPPPGPGQGAIETGIVAGRSWITVRGNADADLLRAARLLAGALPHTQTLSSPTLEEVESGFEEFLEEAGAPGRVTLTRVVVGTELPALFGRFEATSAISAFTALDSLEAFAQRRAAGNGAANESENVPQTQSDTLGLQYKGISEVTLISTANPRQVTVATAPAPDSPGPIPGRPGSGAKDALDLSNIYTPDGLLGDSNTDLISDRIDAQIVPGASGTEGLSDLTARLGLETTGLTVPLLRTPEETEEPASAPTLVLTGTEHPLIDALVDSGRINLDDLAPGQGLIRLVPEAHGKKPALVVTGPDQEGARRAMSALAETFPHIGDRGKDRPTIDDVEYQLWQFLSGRSPAGQAAIGMYKLDAILSDLTDEELVELNILMSLEKPDPELEAMVRGAAAALGLPSPSVTIDNRDVENAATIFEDRFIVPSEVDRFREILQNEVLRGLRPGEPVTIKARISEPPEIRRQLEVEAQALLTAAGATSPSVQVLSAFKQGYSWLDEDIKPRLSEFDADSLVLRFRRNDPPEEWPQQAMNGTARWLHEVFPFDEVFARDTDLDLSDIRFEMTDTGPTYQVQVFGGGAVLIDESFEPHWVLRPYFDRFTDYEKIRVTTGWIHAQSGNRTLADQRIITDLEWVWDRFQGQTLPAIYDYVMDRHDGSPRGNGNDAPFFGELTVDLTLSEPHRALDIDKEFIAPMDALHEEVYFATVEFFQLLGRNSRGQNLTFPGRILPYMRPKGDGADGVGSITLTGFATSRPAVVVSWKNAQGKEGETRLDIPKIAMGRPSARRAVINANAPGIDHLSLRVKVDTEADIRDSLLVFATPLRVDESMLSAEQVSATMALLDEMRSQGLYESALAFPGLGEISVWAEWSHKEDPETRSTSTLAANGIAGALPDWQTLLPDGWDPATDPGKRERIVQWQEPIAPPEGHTMLARMAASHSEASMYRVGTSYLGKDIWAVDLMSPVGGTHWSHAKATTFKPTVVYSARQHANEVSSTSHVLRHAELLLTDPEQRKRLDKVNVVIHPFTNPDGAQLAYDLYRITPDLILHAGYLGSLGADATSGSTSPQPIYPESKVRPRLWNTWLPDVFLNPHGYPSRQLVQLFSEYMGLVRRGRVTERNWGFNKGWFMPGFGYIDDPRYPRHKDAAFQIRDYITKGIRSNADVFAMNQRNYARYARYGVAYEPDVFRMPMADSVLIEMPLKGSGPPSGGRGFNPKITVWSGTTEAPDETAYGPWMELVAKAGLSWDQAILDYLYDGKHRVKRSGSTFFGGVTLKMLRPRPPETDEASPETDETPPAPKN